METDKKDILRGDKATRLPKQEWNRCPCQRTKWKGFVPAAFPPSVTQGCSSMTPPDVTHWHQDLTLFFTSRTVRNKLPGLRGSDTVAQRNRISGRGVCWGCSGHKHDDERGREGDNRWEEEHKCHVIRRQRPWVSPAGKLLPDHPMK